jgi:hypothetical protein
LEAPWGLALDPQAYAQFHVVEEGSGRLRLFEEQAQPLR